jgi:hypothetical protein
MFSSFFCNADFDENTAAGPAGIDKEEVAES